MVLSVLEEPVYRAINHVMACRSCIIMQTANEARNQKGTAASYPPAQNLCHDPLSFAMRKFTKRDLQCFLHHVCPRHWTSSRLYPYRVVQFDILEQGVR